MYLLTKSETLNANAAATLTGAADAGKVIDGDVTTAVEAANREPILNIDLGSPKVVDVIFIKGENLQDYDISASNNNITYTTIRTGETVAHRTQQFPHIHQHNAVSLLAVGIFPTRCIRSELPCGGGVSDASALGPEHRREASAPLPTVYPTRVGLWRMRPIIGNACPVQHGRRGENDSHFPMGVSGKRCCRCARITLERGAPCSRAHGLPAS